MSSLPIATQAEAEVGMANDKVMTPLRTKEAIDALGVSLTALASPFRRYDGWRGRWR